MKYKKIPANWKNPHIRWKIINSDKFFISSLQNSWRWILTYIEFANSNEMNERRENEGNIKKQFFNIGL